MGLFRKTVRVKTNAPWVGCQQQCPACICYPQDPHYHRKTNTVRAKCWNCGCAFETLPGITHDKRTPSP